MYCSLNRFKVGVSLSVVSNVKKKNLNNRFWAFKKRKTVVLDSVLSMDFCGWVFCENFSKIIVGEVINLTIHWIGVALDAFIIFIFVHSWLINWTSHKFDSMWDKWRINFISSSPPPQKKN